MSSWILVFLIYQIRPDSVGTIIICKRNTRYTLSKTVKLSNQNSYFDMWFENHIICWFVNVYYVNTVFETYAI